MSDTNDINKEILYMVDSVSNEKGFERDTVFEALEAALAQVVKRRFLPEEAEVRVEIHREDGTMKTFRQWHVVADSEEELEEPGMQIKLSDAQKTDATMEVENIIEEEIESVNTLRISAQHAKQAFAQKIREAERTKVANKYTGQIGELIIGMVKRVMRDGIILDLGDNAEALLPREEMIPRETFHQNDRVRAYLYAVQEDRKGPQLLVSRTHATMLMKLFSIEVPEIAEQVIEIRSAARDPGSRAKIAVKTNDGRIDPIGACVGMRGSRVQAVSNELNGERIDIVLWDDNPAQLVINAMAPAEVSSIVADEEKRSMDIAVKEEQLSQAIGRGGQNVRLASELTGWTLNVMSEDESQKKSEAESEDVKKVFSESLDVDEDIASVLINEGFSTVEEVAYVDESELLSIDEFDKDMVEELRARARNAILAKELSEDVVEPAKDLLDLDAVTPDMAKLMAKKGVITRDDLADLAVDELLEIHGLGLNEETAAELIMKARAHWFADEQNDE